MTSLQSELHRLYLVAPEAEARSSDAGVRALVVELTRPPTWKVLSTVWYGVQSDLGLPAPAIAVSGIDGLQLWFSIAEPVDEVRARSFLEGLRLKFLPGIETDRVRLLSSSIAMVPALQPQTGNWSAFLAPDLAPIFAETPWLDIAPNEEGQAALLRGLKSMERQEFDAASRRLGPSAEPPQPHGAPTPAAATATTENETACQPGSSAATQDPRQFLLQVMNDASVTLALRIEAAKVLLQHA